MVVVVEVVFQAFLYFVNRFILFFASLDAEVLVQEGTMQVFDKAITLGPADFSFSMLNALQLKE